MEYDNNHFIIASRAYSLQAQVCFSSFIRHIATHLIISSGARPALPIVVAPEAIVEIFRV
jgi:hypothetical protein